MGGPVGRVQVCLGDTWCLAGHDDGGRGRLGGVVRVLGLVPLVRFLACLGVDLTRYYWAQLGGVFVPVVVLVELEKIVAQLDSGK